MGRLGGWSMWWLPLLSLHSPSSPIDQSHLSIQLLWFTIYELHFLIWLKVIVMWWICYVTLIAPCRAVLGWSACPLSTQSPSLIYSPSTCPATPRSMLSSSHNHTLCYVQSRAIISHHIISYHIISYHIISDHIIWYDIISYHIYRIISYHTYTKLTIPFNQAGGPGTWFRPVLVK